jgi:hypothetical protein
MLILVLMLVLVLALSGYDMLDGIGVVLSPLLLLLIVEKEWEEPFCLYIPQRLTSSVLGLKAFSRAQWLFVPILACGDPPSMTSAVGVSEYSLRAVLSWNAEARIPPISAGCTSHRVCGQHWRHVTSG